MVQETKIDQLTIEGFKSIKKATLVLNDLNVLIGANGVGKSNFIEYFRLLRAMTSQQLQIWTAQQGSADRILSFGIKETSVFFSEIHFGANAYRFKLTPTVDGGFVFTEEQSMFESGKYNTPYIEGFGTGHKESLLQTNADLKPGKVADYCYRSIVAWKVFHFHDTSDTAAMKRWGALQDNEYLRPDASNLAAYLYRLSQEFPSDYQQIIKTIRLAMPFFDDFVFKPRILPTEEAQINLQWRQHNTDYILWPSQLSDGSLRFICLVVALLQPDPPSTIIIDEPELGLHPYAISLLASLLRSASTRMQVIVSTQSVPLVNEFLLEDLIVVERGENGSTFKRCAAEEFSVWLEDYSVGELWEKNVLGGRPQK